MNHKIILLCLLSAFFAIEAACYAFNSENDAVIINAEDYSYYYVDSTAFTSSRISFKAKKSIVLYVPLRQADIIETADRVRHISPTDFKTGYLSKKLTGNEEFTLYILHKNYMPLTDILNNVFVGKSENIKHKVAGEINCDSTIVCLD